MKKHLILFLFTIAFGDLVLASPSVDEVLDKMVGKWSGEDIGPVPYPIWLELEKHRVKGIDAAVYAGKYSKIEGSGELVFKVRFSKNHSFAPNKFVYLMEIENITETSLEKGKKQTLLLTDVTTTETGEKELIFWTSGLESGAGDLPGISAWGYKISFEEETLNFGVFSGNLYCQNEKGFAHCATGYYFPYLLEKSQL